MAAGAVWAGITASVCTSAIGCTERERPDRIGDPEGAAAERAVSGSFRAPTGGAAGAGAAPVNDGGAAATQGPGMTDAGSAASTPPGALTLQQTYEGRCDGSTVQWGFFTFQAATPADSSILFRVRTAATETELGSGTYLDLLTASAALGTERCSITGPAPCPIDLYVLLGGAPLAHHPFAELQVLLSPTSDDRMPTVEAWQLTYSCTFNQ